MGAAYFCGMWLAPMSLRTKLAFLLSASALSLLWRTPTDVHTERFLVKCRRRPW